MKDRERLVGKLEFSLVSQFVFLHRKFHRKKNREKNIFKFFFRFFKKQKQTKSIVFFVQARGRISSKKREERRLQKNRSLTRGRLGGGEGREEIKVETSS